MRVACYVVPDAQSHNLPSHGLEGVIFLVVSEWPYPKPRPRRCIGKHPQLGGDNTGGVAPVVPTEGHCDDHRPNVGCLFPYLLILLLLMFFFFFFFFLILLIFKL